MRQLATEAGRRGDVKGLMKLAEQALSMAQSGMGLALLNQRSEIAAAQVAGGSLTPDQSRLLSRAQPSPVEAWPEW